MSTEPERNRLSTLKEWVNELPKDAYAREQYEELLQDQKILNALLAGGVQSWDWYDASLEGLD